VAALTLAAVVLAGDATASSPETQQRIVIAFHPRSGTFVLTPITSGRIRTDSGTYGSCCWTRCFLSRDGQSIEVDNPTVSFTGKRGTFTWHERISYIDSNNDYTVATAVWTIVHGTGAYTHLEGHGQEAAVDRTAEGREVAAQAEGLVDLGPVDAPGPNPEATRSGPPGPATAPQRTACCSKESLLEDNRGC
jgi:hypothetical protein